MRIGNDKFISQAWKQSNNRRIRIFFNTIIIEIPVRKNELDIILERRLARTRIEPLLNIIRRINEQHKAIMQQLQLLLLLKFGYLNRFVVTRAVERGKVL